MHSRTGALAFSETPIIDTTLFAINEINIKGGVLGKQIEPIVADGESDPEIFAKQAEKLILEKKVEIIFGCWTSASRKAVKPIVEKYDKLLFYPVQYEGLEESKNIIYLDLTPNQQIIPALQWAITNLGKKVFLVGSDYIYPRTANEIIKEFATEIGASLVGEEYIKLNKENFSEIIKKIESSKPDVILNTINGSDNIAFFKELDKILNANYSTNVISFSLSESDFKLLDIDQVKGAYICWAYTENIKTKENEDFLKQFKAKFGKHREINDTMQTAYYGVYLWKDSVKLSNSTATEKIRSKLTTFVFNSPEGIIKVEKDGNSYNPIYLVKINKNLNSEIAWQSNIAIQPIAFPNDFFISKFLKNAKTKNQWEQFLQDLYKKWGNKWEAT